MLTRTLLISLILCLFAVPMFGAIADSGGNTTFLWAADAESDSNNGGGAKTSAWDAGTSEDFIDAGGGAPTSNTLAWAGSKTANTVVEHTGNAVKCVAGTAGWFAACTTGTIGNFVFNTNTGLDDSYYITRIDNDSFVIDGLTYSGDFGSVDDDCDTRVGGAIDSMANIINTDLADATAVNCDVLIKGDEILGADVTLASGGGTASTLLRFLGVDTDWVRIVPTRTTASGGSKANYLLDASIMPTITLNTGVEFVWNVGGLSFDGLYFTGDSPAYMIGSTTGDFHTVTNCVFKNINTGASAMCLRTDNNATIDNCDFIGLGASGSAGLLRPDERVLVQNCRFENATSSTTAYAIAPRSGVINNCLFYDLSGIGVKWIASASTLSVVNRCTFENVLTCIEKPSADGTATHVIIGNIAKDCTTFATNLFGSDDILLAQYNLLNNVTNDYVNWTGQIGFQDLTTDPLFVNEANDDYNLQASSPAKNSGPFLTNRGAMSDAEAAAGGIKRGPGMTGGIDG